MRIKAVQEQITLKCHICGREFCYGNREDGMPNGMTFVLKDNSRKTMCADCILKTYRQLTAN